MQILKNNEIDNFAQIPRYDLNIKENISALESKIKNPISIESYIQSNGFEKLLKLINFISDTLDLEMPILTHESLIQNLLCDGLAIEFNGLHYFFFSIPILTIDGGMYVIDQEAVRKRDEACSKFGSKWHALFVNYLHDSQIASLFNYFLLSDLQKIEIDSDIHVFSEVVVSDVNEIHDHRKRNVYIVDCLVVSDVKIQLSYYSSWQFGGCKFVKNKIAASLTDNSRLTLLQCEGLELSMDLKSNGSLELIESDFPSACIRYLYSDTARTWGAGLNCRNTQLKDIEIICSDFDGWLGFQTCRIQFLKISGIGGYYYFIGCHLNWFEFKNGTEIKGLASNGCVIGPEGPMLNLKMGAKDAPGTVKTHLIKIVKTRIRGAIDFRGFEMDSLELKDITIEEPILFSTGKLPNSIIVRSIVIDHSQIKKDCSHSILVFDSHYEEIADALSGLRRVLDASGDRAASNEVQALILEANAKRPLFGHPKQTSLRARVRCFADRAPYRVYEFIGGFGFSSLKPLRLIGINFVIFLTIVGASMVHSGDYEFSRRPLEWMAPTELITLQFLELTPLALFNENNASTEAAIRARGIWLSVVSAVVAASNLLATFLLLLSLRRKFQMPS